MKRLEDNIEEQKKELRKDIQMVPLLTMLSANLSVELVYIILKSLYEFAQTQMGYEFRLDVLHEVEKKDA